MKEIPTVTLKNGTEEVEPFVRRTMLSLRRLMESNVIALYELRERCRDPQHKLSGNTEKVLEDCGLLEPDSGVHSSIRRIVNLAVEGEGLEMKLVSPLKQ